MEYNTKIKVKPKYHFYEYMKKVQTFKYLKSKNVDIQNFNNLINLQILYLSNNQVAKIKNLNHINLRERDPS